MKKYYLALDLKDDPILIAEYERWHMTENAWPEITESMTGAGILNMEIYRVGNRLFMIMETDEAFDFAKKANMDKVNPKVQQWEQLMSEFQQSLPFSKEHEKWLLMKKIFQLAKNDS